MQPTLIFCCDIGLIGVGSEQESMTPVPKVYCQCFCGRPVILILRNGAGYAVWGTNKPARYQEISIGRVHFRNPTLDSHIGEGVAQLVDELSISMRGRLPYQVQGEVALQSNELVTGSNQS